MLVTTTTPSPLPVPGACQRWSNRQHSFRHVSEGGFDARRYDVTPIDEPIAKAYVTQHHYSGSYPSASLRYGLYEGGELVGVAALSVPFPAVLTGVFPELQPNRESLELGRLVLADRVPANAETWMLARVFDLAAQTGIRGIVSFSDPTPRTTLDGAVVLPGHYGTVYQASNARFCGRGKARRIAVLPNGHVFNERCITKIRSQCQGHEYAEAALVAWGASALQSGEDPRSWLNQALLDANVRWMSHPGNLRYAFALGNKAERRAVNWGMPSLPYLKRDTLVA